MKLKVKKLVDHAQLPTFGSNKAAGMDLYSAETKTIPAGRTVLVKTGIAVSFPAGNALLLWDRSGLASKHHLHRLAGVIDADYRGEIGIVLTNLSTKSYTVTQGERVCQALLTAVERPTIEEVDDLSKTTRGRGGFGSTGTH